MKKLFPTSIRYSQFNASDSNVLIIDSIGLLNKLYQYADVAYVGGGFRSGLHNVFEATAYGVPTIFGPDTSRFPDAGEMADKGFAFRVHSKQVLKSKLEELLGIDQTELRSRIKKFMESRTGATKAILEYTKNC